MQPDRQRLDQRTEVGGERVGERDGFAGVDPHVLGERACASTDPDEVGLFAVRGLTRHARQALAAAEQRQRGDVLALTPLAVRIGADRDHFTAELVAHHQPRGHHRPELEIGAADAAGGDPQHELAASGRGVGDLGNLEIVGVGEDGSAHERTLEP